MNNNIDIFHSVKSEAINELSPEILETGFDLLTESEIIKEIPIFGLGFKGYSLYQKITESFFIKKLLKFLFEIKDIPQSDREKFVSEIELNDETKKAGEKLLVTLNRLNDIEKAEIIGRLFKKTILGIIDYNDFSRLTHIIDNSYIDDIKLLKNNPYLNKINEETKSNLNQIGLLNQNISDIKKQKLYLSRAMSSQKAQPKLEYKTNKYCLILINHGLK